MEDYYEILGIARDATASDIKKAYRKLAMKYHPDKNKGNVEAKERFQDIAEAYDVLSDPEKKNIYDLYGMQGLTEGVPDADGETHGGGYSFKESAAFEIFKDFFGSTNPFSAFGFESTTPFDSAIRPPPPKKDPPIEKDLLLSLEELFNGCVKKISITRKRFVPKATKKVEQEDDEEDNEDEVLEDQTKVLTIRVQPGWRKGTKLTFESEGDEGEGKLPADIVFIVKEKPHEHYQREGNNLIFTCQISLARALTDCTLAVPTLDDRQLSISCNEVVSPASEKRITGEGMPDARDPNKRGDLIIRFSIKFPKYLSKERRKTLAFLLAEDEEDAEEDEEEQERHKEEQREPTRVR